MKFVLLCQTFIYQYSIHGYNYKLITTKCDCDLTSYFHKYNSLSSFDENKNYHFFLSLHAKNATVQIDEVDLNHYFN